MSRSGTPPLVLCPPPEPTPDVSDAAHTDPATLEDAFRRYSAYVAHIGVRILGQGDDVDDLVQDVFVEAARGLGRVRGAAAVKGWLGTVTARVAVRRLRRRRLRRLFRLEDEVGEAELVWPGAGPEECALVARVYHLLDRIPARWRVAWILRCVEGEQLDEVARRCECSLATAKRWVAAAQLWIDRNLSHLREPA